jgi:hypothetical protein
MLAPLIVREIVYRLLMGAQSSRMRHLAMFGEQAHRMVRAVEKLRTSYVKPLRIEGLAKQLGMSVSGFHAHLMPWEAEPIRFRPLTSTGMETVTLRRPMPTTTRSPFCVITETAPSANK